MQTVINNYTGGEDIGSSADSDAVPDRKGQAGGENYSYEQAVERQKQEGGPRRYYGEDEGLDTDVARITDENGNPVAKKKDGGGDMQREYLHVHVAYCIG